MSLLRKVETAIQTYLERRNFPDVAPNIYTGIRNSAKEGPCVIIVAKSKRENPINTGNYLVHVIVTTKGLADVDPENTEEWDTAQAKFNAIVATVVGALDEPDFKEQISALVDDFTCWGCSDKTGDTDVEVIAWHEIREMDLYCCGSDIG